MATGPTENDLSYFGASYDGGTNTVSLTGNPSKVSVHDIYSGSDNGSLLGDINIGDNTTNTSLSADVYQRDYFESPSLGGLYYYGLVTINGVTGFLAANNKFYPNATKWYFFVKSASANQVASGPQTSGSLTLATNGSNTWTVSNSPSAGPTAQCFLQGTRILTPHGDTPIEALSVGDQVITFKNGQKIYKDITWIGHAQQTTMSDLPLDKSGFPVRIHKDAFAPQVPSVDLLITSEHSIFFDGHLVPVRMLVNHRSITYDTSIISYTYYHLETEPHSIICAHGVLTESYLDTGTRHHFTHDGNIVSFSSKHKTWEHDSAAPLGVTRAFVEPIYQRLVDRAHQLSCAQEPAAPSLTDDSNLHLQTKHGQDIYPKRRKGSWVIFDIPSHIHDVYILSRAGRPCDTIGPFVDDRRELGVAVGEVILFEEEATTNIDAHLHHRTLDGWHKHEHPAIRWTKGKAFLPLKKSLYQQIRLLAIEIREGGPYLNHAEERWHRTAS